MVTGTAWESEVEGGADVQLLPSCVYGVKPLQMGPKALCMSGKHSLPFERGSDFRLGPGRP